MLKSDLQKAKKLISFTEASGDRQHLSGISLSEDEQEYFEERAAIMEYEAGLNRHEAERLALDYLFSRRIALSKAG
jgi:hypothetical protein